MGTRLQFQKLLESFFPDQDDPPVYFQPPANIHMRYPCIVYDLDDADTAFANNKPYRYTERYAVTVIDTDPDSELRLKVAALPMSRANRFYPTDNLNHFVYNVYF